MFSEIILHSPAFDALVFTHTIVMFHVRRVPNLSIVGFGIWDFDERMKNVVTG